MLKEDDFASEYIAPEGGIQKSSFSEANNTRGLEQFLQVVEVFYARARQTLAGKYTEFGDGHARYELTYNVSHHDHLIYKQCNRIIEFENKEIEKLQEEVARKNNFTTFSHRLEHYGTCGSCSGKNIRPMK